MRTYFVSYVVADNRLFTTENIQNCLVDAVSQDGRSGDTPDKIIDQIKSRLVSIEDLESTTQIRIITISSML